MTQTGLWTEFVRSSAWKAHEFFLFTYGSWNGTWILIFWVRFKNGLQTWIILHITTERHNRFQDWSFYLNCSFSSLLLLRRLIFKEINNRKLYRNMYEQIQSVAQPTQCTYTYMSIENIIVHLFTVRKNEESAY